MHRISSFVFQIGRYSLKYNSPMSLIQGGFKFSSDILERQISKEEDDLYECKWRENTPVITSEDAIISSARHSDYQMLNNLIEEKDVKCKTLMWIIQHCGKYGRYLKIVLKAYRRIWEIGSGDIEDQLILSYVLRCALKSPNSRSSIIDLVMQNTLTGVPIDPNIYAKLLFHFQSANKSAGYYRENEQMVLHLMQSMAKDTSPFVNQLTSDIADKWANKTKHEKERKRKRRTSIKSASTEEKEEIKNGKIRKEEELRAKGIKTEKPETGNNHITMNSSKIELPDGQIEHIGDIEGIGPNLDIISEEINKELDAKLLELEHKKEEKLKNRKLSNNRKGNIKPKKETTDNEAIESLFETVDYILFKNFQQSYSNARKLKKKIKTDMTNENENCLGIVLMNEGGINYNQLLNNQSQTHPDIREDLKPLLNINIQNNTNDENFPENLDDVDN